MSFLPVKYQYYTTDKELFTARDICNSLYTSDSGIIATLNKPDLAIVVTDSSIEVGFIVLYFGSNRRYPRAHIYVKKSERKHGYGTGLINHLIIAMHMFPKYHCVDKILFDAVSYNDEPTYNFFKGNENMKKESIRSGHVAQFVMPIEKDTSSIGDLFREDTDIIKESYDYKPGYCLEDTELTKFGLRTKDNYIFFNEMTDENILEADHVHDQRLRKMLYNERIRTDKAVLGIYKNVKQQVPFIRFTFLTYDRYSNKNLFIDLSHYTNVFMNNNKAVLDKAVLLYLDFITRYMDDRRLEKFYTKRTVFVPLSDWTSEDQVIWDYKTNINPISVICRLLVKDIAALKNKWGDMRFLFLSDNGYFAIDINSLERSDVERLKRSVKILLSKEPIPDDTEDSKESSETITLDIIDKIETSQNVVINNLTGRQILTPEEIEDIHNTATSSSEMDETKSKLVSKIKDIADSSKSVDTAISDMDNDPEIKKLIADIAANDANVVKISAARSSRALDLNTKFSDINVRNKTVKEILEDNPKERELPETALNVDSINDEWNHMRFINFEKEYDIDQDILAILKFFGTRTIPVNIIDINIIDTTTSEDRIETWEMKCEDIKGTRFTLRLDIPKLKNNRYMRLRGNEKVLQGQLMNLPVIKTDEDTCQIVSNYNKIFVRRFGSASGKSYVSADKLIKALNKYNGKRLKVVPGDNSKICSKYELPFDYIDLAKSFSSIEIRYDDGTTRTFMFNQDEIYKKYKVDKSYGIPIGYEKKGSSKNGRDLVLYFNTNNHKSVSDDIVSMLNVDKDFAKIYKSVKPGVRYCYSKASILNSEIPVIVILGYNEGLTTALKKAGIGYEFFDRKPTDITDMDYIKFKDGYVGYLNGYTSSLLMNGLKECNTEDYYLKDIDGKQMWLDFLDCFGGRIKADGLDNFYDLMIDPITEIICKRYNLPVDYTSALIYANNLLADNKYNKHVDITGNRYRNNEIIAGYTYKILANAYAEYRNMLKRSSRAVMSVKQSAVIDAILMDNTESDVSTINEINFVESTNALSSKGLSGLNSERAYSLDKRTYHDSMTNVIGMSTGFAANVGVTRQGTIDMNVEGTRGYIKPSGIDNMSITKTFTMTEAMTPFGATSDDPFRTAMTFIQTAKHSMRTKQGDPLLITNGADEALPYLTPDVFSYNAKNDGKVLEKTDDYIILEYKDGSHEYIDLTEQVYKNSDGGFFLTVKLESDLKVGDKVKERQVVALDPLSYTVGEGPNNNPRYNLGILCKVAIMNADEGFEDSTVISEWLSEASESEIVMPRQVTLPKMTNVYNVIKVGQKVQEGDPLMYLQNTFDEEDANILLKNLTVQDGEELIAELGRIPIKSDVTGVVQDIKIYRTAEIDEMSESLQKLVTDYEKAIAKRKKIIEKYDPDKAKEYRANYKLDPIGKLKNVKDGVLIEFYLKFIDKAGIGDKFVVQSALKGVSKGVIPKELTPTSEFRPDEPIDIFLTVSSVNARMVTSIQKSGNINKGLIELDRQVKEIMGIKWNYLHE